MKISEEWIRHNFKGINRRHFKGILKQPKFAVDTLTNSYGTYEWGYDNEGRLITSTITISDNFVLSERQYRNVLAHEMIHLYIRQKGISERVSHGRTFRKVMKYLNKRGFDIRTHGTPQ